MNLPDMIFARARALPTDLQKEALDFIGYLESRYRVADSKAQDPDTEAFLARVAGSLGDDFPDDVDGQDLGKDVSRDNLP